MKKLPLIFFSVGLSLTASAQHTLKSETNESLYLHIAPQSERTRTEIILPMVNGYKVIKADLHVHTYFSDGSVSPEHRAGEGWADGLDAIAVTDHIEYRPHEKHMIRFLGKKVSANKVKKGDVTCDLNCAVELARQRAGQYGITIIPGVEITRDPVSVGHFNALFTTDNNLIPDPDPLQSLRNARKQGALIQINHPGWRRTDNGFTDVAKEAIKEGLIDGVEVLNSNEFYPDVIERAVKEGFYISGGTDIHHPSYNLFGRFGVFRNMTLILAKDASAESIREGLESRRTLAYAYGDIAGSEALLKDFFRACVEFKLLPSDKEGERHIIITNRSSIPYSLSYTGGTPELRLEGMSSIVYTTRESETEFTITNMWYGPDKHPSVKIK